MKKSNLNQKEWSIINRLTRMNLKRLSGNLLDTKTKFYNSEIRRERHIEEIEADIANHQLLLLKSELNLEIESPATQLN